MRRHEQRLLIREVSVRGRAGDRRCVGGLLDRGRYAFGNEGAGCRDERFPSAAFLANAAIQLIWD
jgi:hypothetical protein